MKNFNKRPVRDRVEPSVNAGEPLDYGRTSRIVGEPAGKMWSQRLVTVRLIALAGLVPLLFGIFLEKWIELLSDEQVPIPPPPTSPAPPAPGRQTTDEVTSQFPCVPAVEEATTQWAREFGFVVTVSYRSRFSIDMDLLPEKITNPTSADFDNFTQSCRLFTETYAADAAKKKTLRKYVEATNLQPSTVSSHSMQQIGFTLEDATHLREHLARIEGDIRNALTHGLRYLRVNYSFEPRRELTTTMGTESTDVDSSSQLELFASLRAAALNAASCKRDQAR